MNIFKKKTSPKGISLSLLSLPLPFLRHCWDLTEIPLDSLSLCVFSWPFPFLLWKASFSCVDCALLFLFCFRFICKFVVFFRCFADEQERNDGCDPRYVWVFFFISSMLHIRNCLVQAEIFWNYTQVRPFFEQWCTWYYMEFQNTILCVSNCVGLFLCSLLLFS